MNLLSYLRKKSPYLSRKKPKDYTIFDKIDFYYIRMNDPKLTLGQRKFATKRHKHLTNVVDNYKVNFPESYKTNNNGMRF